jgi:hypothetical protein
MPSRLSSPKSSGFGGSAPPLPLSLTVDQVNITKVPPPELEPVTARFEVQIFGEELFTLLRCALINVRITLFIKFVMFLQLLGMDYLLTLK